jgi:hypothetical protein
LIGPKARIRAIFKGDIDLRNVDSSELGYLAGLVDGEGAVSIDRFRPRIRIGMQSTLPVKLAKKFGGPDTEKTYVTKRRRKRTGKMEYTWEISKRPLLKTFIEQIKPHSKLKNKQLELMLKAIDIIDAKKQTWKDKVAEIKKEIQRLNHASFAPPDLDLNVLKELPWHELEKRLDMMQLETQTADNHKI